MAMQMYGDKFDYKFIKENDVIENYSSVPIQCQKHGLFFTNVYDFLCGNGCFDCTRCFENIDN